MLIIRWDRRLPTRQRTPWRRSVHGPRRGRATLVASRDNDVGRRERSGRQLCDPPAAFHLPLLGGGVQRRALTFPPWRLSFGAGSRHRSAPQLIGRMGRCGGQSSAPINIGWTRLGNSRQHAARASLALAHRPHEITAADSDPGAARNLQRATHEVRPSK
jgi:hypothetical protein